MNAIVKNIIIAILVLATLVSLLCVVALPLVCTTWIHHAPSWMTFETDRLPARGETITNARFKRSETIEATCWFLGVFFTGCALSCGITAGILVNKKTR